MSLTKQLKTLLGPRAVRLYLRLRYGPPPMVFKSKLPEGLSFAKDSYKGKRCFIIGGGPSLQDMDLAPLQGEYLMAVNRGYKLRARGIHQVEFYGLSDVNAYQDYGADIPDDFAKHTCIFGAIPWQKKEAGSLSVFSMYAEANRKKFMSSGFFQFDLTQPVAHSYTVVLQMVQVAVYAGFSEIYVLGVDNDFSGPNMHFYPDTAREKHNMVVWGINPCPDNEKAFAAAYDLLKARGILLANAGVGGKLQALPRVVLADICAQ